MSGIVSLVDVLSGEVVLSLVASDSAPLMQLAFDASGSLLVTADRDGIYLNVFQCVGFPTAATSSSSSRSSACIWRHLYRIYRGFRNALIRDLSFSGDSRWMAASSARGTIHLYALRREGGPPSHASHNSAATCVVSQTAMEPQLCEQQSLRKLHHDMHEAVPRKDHNMHKATATGGTKICAVFHGMRLWVQTPVAFHEYALSTVPEQQSDVETIETAAAEAQELWLGVERLHQWKARELYAAQSVSYPYLHDQLYPFSPPRGHAHHADMVRQSVT